MTADQKRLAHIHALLGSCDIVLLRSQEGDFMAPAIDCVVAVLKAVAGELAELSEPSR